MNGRSGDDSAGEIEQIMVTVSQLARALNVSESWLYHLLAAKKITEADGLVRYGRKMTRFNLDIAVGRFSKGKFATAG